MREFLRVAEAYREKFLNEDGDKFLFEIGKFKSVRDILIELYWIMVREGKCEKIENLPVNQKRELWTKAKMVSEVQETTYLLAVAKALHGFGSYLSEAVKDE